MNRVARCATGITRHAGSRRLSGVAQLADANGDVEAGADRVLHLIGEIQVQLDVRMTTEELGYRRRDVESAERSGQCHTQRSRLGRAPSA